MAVSALRPRKLPLHIACPVWSPWGPGRTEPFEDEEDSDVEESTYMAAEATKVRKMRRSLSWGNYSPHALSCGFRSPSPCSESTDDCSRTTAPTDSDSSEAVDGSTTLAPIDSVDGRSQTDCPRRRPCVDSELPQSNPVLLGSRMGSKVAKSQGHVQESKDAEVTTLMIRNLPYHLPQQGLVDAVNASGFKGLFDFCYLPRKFNDHTNLGFAFLNFVNADAAQKFITEWHQSKIFLAAGMRKAVNVTKAAVQGKEANKLRAASKKMSRVKNASFKPWMKEGSIEEITY